MITSAPKQYSTRDLEDRIQRFWDETGAYKATKAKRSSGEDRYFIDGPPYTSGHIHLGTAWNKILKDTMLRYWRMHGYNIRDQAGFDMHGLPIEVKVEQTLGIKNKKAIKAFGIDQFISKCREFAIEFKNTMTAEFRHLGVWLDWADPYLTIENQYLESAWWTIKRAYDRRLLTQAKRVQSWCSRCETALAEAEVEYWDETDPSIYVKFPIVGRESENESIVIWTTTPWTLPADLAVAVHPDYTYVRMRVEGEAGDEVLIVVESRAEDVARAGRYQDMEILEHIHGSDLEGLRYHHPLVDEVPYHQTAVERMENAHTILLGDHVTAEQTGLVHTAPGFGPEDFELGERYDLEPFCPIDESGRFTADGGKYEELFVKDADPIILEDLRRKGILLADGEMVHRYGHCWRCKTPILYRTTKQWFLRVTKLKDEMLAEIDRVKWSPKWAGSARQYDWVSNARDWCISRQRFWGIPMPIWRCDEGHQRVIGAASELEESEQYHEGMDLHRPWIDAVELKCHRCGGTMRRIRDVLDVWFDSAVSSWAQLHYPMETEEFERWWPCDWITEAHDQTRGWFYSQLGASVVAFDRIPYREVLMHGFALDENGRPMSKSAGTSVEPAEVIEEYGIDALRFYLLRASAPWEDLPFSRDGLKTAKRLFNIFWNVYVFGTTYMEIDGFDPTATTREAVKDALNTEDRWVYSALEGLKTEVAEHINTYQLHKACRALEKFILDDLSRWYVKLIRDRIWDESDAPSKLAAFCTLYDALLETSLLLAPFAPHITEEIYQNLTLGQREPTIHMEDWPASAPKWRDETLETQMDHARSLIEAMAHARQKGRLKLRWPVVKAIVETDDAAVCDAAAALDEILRDQANVKTVQLLEPGTQWSGLVIEHRPNYRALGPVFKGRAKAVAKALAHLEPATVYSCLGPEAVDAAEEVPTLELELEIELEIEGEGDAETVTITPAMVNFETRLPEGFEESELGTGETRVYMDVTINDETRAEGYARELVRRIQDMRKTMDLDIEEFIAVNAQFPADLVALVEPWHAHIAEETRAKHLAFDALGSKPVPEMAVEEYGTETFGKRWEIEGHRFEIAIARLEDG